MDASVTCRVQLQVRGLQYLESGKGEMFHPFKRIAELEVGVLGVHPKGRDVDCLA